MENIANIHDFHKYLIDTYIKEGIANKYFEESFLETLIQEEDYDILIYAFNYLSLDARGKEKITCRFLFHIYEKRYIHPSIYEICKIAELETLYWLLQCGFPYDIDICIKQAEYERNIEPLKLIYTHFQPFPSYKMVNLITTERFDLIEPYYQMGCPLHIDATFFCVVTGHIDILKKLLKMGFPYDREELIHAGYVHASYSLPFIESLPEYQP